MRVIGRIELKSTDDGTILNAEYVGGSIVELTSKETVVLKMLQDACDGRQWQLDNILSRHYDKPQDLDMSEAFALVLTFAQTRFAINDFKEVVNRLEETINRLDQINEL